MSNLPKPKLKIIVKIRNPREDDVKKSNLSKTVDEKKFQQIENKVRSLNKIKVGAKSPNKNNGDTKDKLNINANYTIFTSIDKSNLCVVTNNGISGKLIQETFQTSNEIYDYSVNLMNNSSILEFDAVYNEQYKLDQIYHEQIKEPISEMLMGKNSCILVFGPSQGGKSYTIRGGEKEKGLLDKAVDDLFNFVEINQQINNQGKQNRTINKFRLKIVIYYVYEDKVYDLLNGIAKQIPLKLEKTFNNETNETYTSLIDLNERDIKNRKEFLNTLVEAIRVRKNQAQLGQINCLNNKSNLVISLILEKMTKFNDGYSKSNETTLEKFSQVDFVEIASSQYGLPLSQTQKSKTKNDLNNKSISSSKVDNVNKIFNDNLELNCNKIIEKTFNSLCDNIVSASHQSQAKTESKLSLCLKPTLNKNSNIIFLICVLPCELPPTLSFKSLKFGNWMRNQIYNYEPNVVKSRNQIKEDSDVEVESPDIIEYTKVAPKSKTKYNNPESEEARLNKEKSADELNCINTRSADFNETKNFNENRTFNEEQNIYDDEKPFKLNNQYGNKEETPYNAYKQQYYNYKDEINYKPYNQLKTSDKDGTLFKPYNQQRNSYFEENDNFQNSSNNIRTLNNYKYKNEINKTYQNDEINQKTRQFEEVYQMKNLEERKEGLHNEIKNLEKYSKTIRHVPDNTLTISDNFVNNSNTSKNLYETKDFRQENMIMKSDLIIFKEENSQLKEVNKNLQAQIDKMTLKINEISLENTNLIQDKISKQHEIERLNSSMLKGNTIFNASGFNVEKSRFGPEQQFNLESKIRELENTNKNLFNEKQKFEIDFKVLSERYFELKKTYDSLQINFNQLKDKQNDEMDIIEEKLEKMCKELENLQKENHTLKSNEEKLKPKLINLEKKIIKKSEKCKVLNENVIALQTKLKELETFVNDTKIHKLEESKKNSIDNKKRLLEEMQNKIANFKNVCKKRNKVDEE